MGKTTETMIEKLNDRGYFLYQDKHSRGKVIIITSGPAPEVIELEPNEFEPGSDEWATKEMEDYLTIKKFKE
ncbi:MAG TPA: hypothetical protein VFW07_19455 [Parafilimonas sp.]|nr:hypothetical protein [Parafilimonas sp.]